MVVVAGISMYTAVCAEDRRQQQQQQHTIATSTITTATTSMTMIPVSNMDQTPGGQQVDEKTGGAEGDGFTRSFTSFDFFLLQVSASAGLLPHVRAFRALTSMIYI